MKAYIEPLICSRCHKEFFPRDITAHSSRRRFCDNCILERNASNCKAYRESSDYMTAGVHIKKEHKKFLDKNYINFSKFIRIKLDELMAQYEQQGKRV